jgi:hypothetical protein
MLSADFGFSELATADLPRLADDGTFEPPGAYLATDLTRASRIAQKLRRPAAIVTMTLPDRSGSLNQLNQVGSSTRNLQNQFNENEQNQTSWPVLLDNLFLNQYDAIKSPAGPTASSPDSCFTSSIVQTQSGQGGQRPGSD